MSGLTLGNQASIFAPKNRFELRQAVVKYFHDNSTFAYDITQWDVSAITDFSHIFRYMVNLTDHDLSAWNVSNAISMAGMFSNCTNFNGNIGNWQVSKVISMASMFAEAAAFNQDLSSWDVSSVTDFSFMFYNAGNLNQSGLGSWNVTSGANFQGMFLGAGNFTDNISGWDTSNAIDFTDMFNGATVFNTNLSSWNVTNVMSTQGTFDTASAFEHDIVAWNVRNVMDMSRMFRLTNISSNYCDWRGQSSQTLVGRMFFGNQACVSQRDPASNASDPSILIGPFCHDCAGETAAAVGIYSFTSSFGPTMLLIGLLINFVLP